MQKIKCIVSKELIKKGIYPNIADTSRESVNRMSQMAKMGLDLRKFDLD